MKINGKIVSAIALALIPALIGCGENTGTSDDSSMQNTADPENASPQDGQSADSTGEAEPFRPDGWGYDSHEKGALVDYETVFPQTKVQVLEISISAETYQDMLQNMTDIYGEGGSGGGGPGAGGGGFPDEQPAFVPVTVEFDGLTWWHVGMRFKGNSTLQSAWRRGLKKLPFRLDFDEFEDTFEEIDDQRFFGFKKLTFSSGFNDDSLIREKIGAEIFREAGVPAARGAFYRVYLDVGDGNGKVYAGLYTMVEDLSNKFLESQFANDSGNLYKPDGDGADWQSFVESGFEKKTNEEESDYSDVQNAIDALHAPRSDAEQWRTELERYFNVEGYLRLLAVNQAIENWDTYGMMTHNYYLYGDPEDNGRLVWLPWDLNECLFPSRGPSGGMSVLLSEVSDRWPVIRYLMDDPV